MKKNIKNTPSFKKAFDMLKPQDRQEKVKGAKLMLEALAKTSKTKPLTKPEIIAAKNAIEVLVQNEGKKRNKGWWFKFGYRIKLAKQYFGKA